MSYRPSEYHAGMRWDAENGVDIGWVPGLEHHKNRRLRERANESKEERKRKADDEERRRLGW